jgi:hypothetical protein
MLTDPSARDWISVAKLPFRRAHQPAAGRRRRGRGYGDPRAQGFDHRNTKSTKISGEGRSQPMGLCDLCVYVAKCRSGGRTSARLGGGGGDAGTETRGPRDLATETQNPQRSPSRGAPSPWAFVIYVFMWLNAVPAGAPAHGWEAAQGTRVRRPAGPGIWPQKHKIHKDLRRGALPAHGPLRSMCLCG